MRLQKMLYKDDDGDIVEVTCAVGSYGGGEYTACGNAIPDSNLDIEDFERIGDEFEGKLKDVTCINCMYHIGYYKRLK